MNEMEIKYQKYKQKSKKWFYELITSGTFFYKYLVYFWQYVLWQLKIKYLLPVQ